MNRLKNLQTNVTSNMWYLINVSFDTAFVRNTVDKIMNQTLIFINVFKK